ncbi:MAG: 4Fe-4S dicluster domain-containing protein [Elusimicrobiota bacterium]
MIPKIRLAAQSLFLLFSLSVFFGLVSGRTFVSLYNSIHVLPALSSIAWLALPPFAAITLLFLVLPLLFGRLYCSYLCPAGFLQEAAARLAKRYGREGRPAAGFNRLRLFILGLSLAFIVLQSSTYHYFDHFSNLGRAYGVFETLARFGPFTLNFVLGALFLTLVLIVPPSFPRWFCGALCPSGTLFMLLQRRSLFKVRISDECTDCGSCTPACPALCIGGGEVDYDLCVHCLECLSACPQDAIGFSFRNPFSNAGTKPAGAEGDPRGRRRFLKAAAYAVLGAFSAAILKTKALGAGFKALATIVPPGAKCGDQFLEKCTACHTCVSVCPTNVLAPSDLENSLLGLAKARMDYGRSFCSYECNACLAVCPSGAISYFPLEVKKTIKIGSSGLDEDLCIPYAEGKDCAACHEVCPTGAITMKPHKSVRAPVLNDDYCIGCGACQHACPVKPVRAIVVKPVEIHTFAFNPKQRKKGEQRIPEPAVSEFPF